MELHLKDIWSDSICIAHIMHYVALLLGRGRALGDKLHHVWQYQQKADLYNLIRVPELV